MYGSVRRDAAYKTRLLDFIRREYLPGAVSITETRRGFYGETYRLETPERSFFVKLDYSADHKYIYRDSFAFIEHMCEYGTDCIARVVKTVNGRLYACFDGAILGVFAWVDGENIQNEHTKIREYQLLAKIYTIPAAGLKLRRETFDTVEADKFYDYLARLRTSADNGNVGQMLDIIDERPEDIARNALRYRLFAQRCAVVCENFHITHGDAGGNIIVNGNRFYIIDWDDVKLAPPERDGWFCMHWRWAADAFENAMRQSGIDHTLNPDTGAYYCYHNFFMYLNAYLAAFFQLPDKQRELADSVSAYFNGWITENLRYADSIE
ncbi:MAG: aminoglycoside phosphotransferase family protein [Eubacteriales bacterium]|jgi:hypothetical protein|nr:aminoglycoside phosphotransferase family protein [Eubacteriales bacterium]